MGRLFITIIVLLNSISSFAKPPWQCIQHPISGVPQSIIGSFSNGCIIDSQVPLLRNPNFRASPPKNFYSMVKHIGV
ncbi:hypothetical protein [Pantoea sp. Nvir]|uniref:hypothetical protein n=1 Tax=Pantoea sp. Nvir TaxID=2576760 RepID=UPI0027F42D6A|nr:hypothetical protein [Pantoea sp. Nvir]CAJ0992117.1 Penicillin-insensitive murein endopeptidase [Pantoea sp. Nvir]